MHVSVIDVLHVGDALNYHVAGLSQRQSGVPGGASHRDVGDRSAWGAPHRDPGDRIRSASHRDKIRVPGMLLTGILEIGVVLLPTNCYKDRNISNEL